jgi:mycothiol synthase
LVTHGRVRDAVRVNVAGRLRDATEDDAEAILAVALLSDIAEIGEPNTTIEEVRGGLVSDSAGAVVDDPAGELLGYAWIDHEPGQVKAWGDITLRPGASPVVGEMLLGWLQARVGELGTGLALHTFSDSTNTLKQRVYEKAGGRVIRRYFRMSVTFADGPPPVPELAPGVEILGVERTDADLRRMYDIVDVAFLDHFGHESGSYEKWRQRTADSSSSDLSLWWVATVDGTPAAGLYGAELPTCGYVDTLGTLRDFRGRGIARALLLTAFEEFYRRGQPRVVLGVDTENPTGALGLYESVGMHAEHEGWRYELV